ncbi:hypothetical protein MUP95_00150 [bacterium]|nr:hypothetical protein [bacterium]
MKKNAYNISWYNKWSFMRRRFQNSYIDDDYCFVEVCKRYGINPYKERYWREEIARVLGVKPDTISKWAGPDRKSRIQLYRWKRNGRIFARRRDLVEAFQDVEMVMNNEG